MNLVSLSLCGILLKPVVTPSQVMHEIYSNTYDCELVQENFNQNVTSLSSVHLYRYFPGNSKFWPIFTADKLPSKEFDEYVKHGIKPGVVIPLSAAENVNLDTYRRFLNASKKGAIIILEGRHGGKGELYSVSTFATALGLRPQMYLKNFYLTDGFMLYEPGSFLLNNDLESRYLTLPNGIHIVGDKSIIPTSKQMSYGEGLQAVINPAFDKKIVQHIAYPPLGVEWVYAGSHFKSSPTGLETSFLGHLLVLTTLVAVPLGLLFEGDLPDLFSLGATTISYVSVVFGSLLVMLFVVAILRNRSR